MPRIHCTRKLWQKGLGLTREPPTIVEAPLVAGARLGGWAATLIHNDGCPLILAVESTTNLTLVCQAVPAQEFRAVFSTALDRALEDLGVSPRMAAADVAAIEVLPFASLSDRAVMAALRDLEFHAQVEFDYSDDLRHVQRNLNDLPRPNRQPYVPAEAVALLFASADDASGALRVH
jgi:hypothetical protein